ncbi:MAG TPA: hypothetical protein VKG62_02505 [Solirubrobacteraceae bacterium]|nr:hypothetical protein [Solirubrobacteraceae bacterium]
MRRTWGALAAVGLACGIGAVGAADATAAETRSTAFTTAGEYPFVVPPGVSSLQVELVGGSGGSGAGEVAGGIGDTVTAVIAVTPGETLYAEAAGNGFAYNAPFPNGNPGGFGGGGVGYVAEAFSGEGGGGGGGASDIRTCSQAPPAVCSGESSLQSRLIVAGGGGGGGGHGGEFLAPGGAGGPAHLHGYPGAVETTHHKPGGEGGGAGGAGEGGAAGEETPDCPAVPTDCAGKGLFGLGGQGGSGAFAGGGGGGGGGIWGGGGGGGGTLEIVQPSPLIYSIGGGGGGGGGSSGVTGPGVSGFSLVPTAVAGQPSVTISWTAPPPAVVTGAASAVTGTTATISGSVNPDLYQVTECHFTIVPAPPAGGSIPCAQQIGSGGAPVAVSASLTALTPGTTYSVTLTAATAQGSSSGSAVTFTTPGGGSGGGLTATNLKLSRTRFRRGTHAAKISAANVPMSTVISFSLSAPATATLSFEQRRAGVIAGHRCVPVSGAHRQGRHCTRYVRLANVLTLPAHAGSDRVAFDGVLSGARRLAPGEYRLSLGASGAAGTARAAQHPTFTLVP